MEVAIIDVLNLQISYPWAKSPTLFVATQSRKGEHQLIPIYPQYYLVHLLGSWDPEVLKTLLCLLFKTSRQVCTVASEQIYSSFIYSSGGGIESRTTMIRTDRTSLNQRKQNFENDEQRMAPVGEMF